MKQFFSRFFFPMNLVMEYYTRLHDIFPSSVQSVLLGAICFLSVWLYLNRPKNKYYNLPPGPKGLPIVGNLFDFSNKAPHLLFAGMIDLFCSSCLVQ